MKKFILAIISAIMLVSLVSCAETSAKNSVEKFFDAYKSIDLSKANEYVEGTGLLQKSIKQFEDYDKERIDALKYWGNNINYKILGTEKSGREVKVDVRVTAPNGSQIYNEYMQNVKALRIGQATLNDNTMDGDAVGGDFDNAFITALENQTNDMVTTNVTIVLKKDNGKWKIQNDKEVLQAMLGGLNPETVIS